MLLTGLDWKYFNWHQMEFYGNLNLLKTGLVFADAVNTVSPRYAEEIQTLALGCGLEGVLQQRRGRAVGHHQRRRLRDAGIPATDAHLAAELSAPTTFAEGKAGLQGGAAARDGAARATKTCRWSALIGRLVDQKGLDLIAAVIQDWVQRHDVQWVVLGTGEREVSGAVARPGRAASRRRSPRSSSSPSRWPTASKPAPTCS